jgi:hypothetical protein
MGRRFVKGRSQIELRIGQWLCLPHKGTPHMSDANILPNAGDITFQHGLIVQTRQGLPYSESNILQQIVGPVWKVFISGRNAAHHRGMDFDDLLQLDYAAPNFVFSCYWVQSLVMTRSYKQIDREAIYAIPAASSSRTPMWSGWILGWCQSSFPGKLGLEPRVGLKAPRKRNFLFARDLGIVRVRLRCRRCHDSLLA